MLTRLRVKGFKNLVDVDLPFGPFTCIAGENGVGKSNLLDAISFLSQLADKPLNQAAASIRDESGRTGDVRSIFHRVGDRYGETIEFDVEMLVPKEGVDDLGQPVVAKTTFLSYGLSIGLKSSPAGGGLELLREELKHIPKNEAHGHLGFDHSAGKWRKSMLSGEGSGHRTAPYLSTGVESDVLTVRLHQEGQGRPRPVRAQSLPRTVLSTASAAEGPTMTLARREMQTWRMVQLEPSFLRRSSSFQEPTMLGANGSHLAAALFHLANTPHAASQDVFLSQFESGVYARVANRLAELIQDIRRVWVDRDERRELLTVMVEDRNGTAYPARALSEGTLRFLALAVLAEDPSSTGVMCMEEPENGIHPSRIPAMIELLHNIAVDAELETGVGNPPRQVIVNTHSPLVINEVFDEDLVFAYQRPAVRPYDGRQERFMALAFGCLPGTWRDSRMGVAPRHVFLPYLSGLRVPFPTEPTPSSRQRRRVANHPWVQEAFEFASAP